MQEIHKWQKGVIIMQEIHKRHMNDKRRKNTYMAKSRVNNTYGIHTWQVSQHYQHTYMEESRVNIMQEIEKWQMKINIIKNTYISEREVSKMMDTYVAAREVNIMKDTQVAERRVCIVEETYKRQKTVKVVEGIYNQRRGEAGWCKLCRSSVQESFNYVGAGEEGRLQYAGKTQLSVTTLYII